MRYPRLVSLLILAFTVSLALSGCGFTSLMSSSSSGGAPPVVSAVAVQVDGVAPNRKQEVQFNEAMNPATITSQSFQVADSAGKLAHGIVSYDPDFNTASFLPNTALQSDATYSATITTAATSADGAHLPTAYSYTFNTRSNSDTSPLLVNSVDPAANATCVSATTAITITFDEAPDVSTVTSGNFMVTGPNGAIPVKISTSVSTTQVVLTPVSALPSGAIAVTVNNVADLAGVKMAAPYTWGFSTVCSGGGSGSKTFVYAGDMTHIAGFAIGADGSATAVPGSPFTLAANALAASPKGNILFGDGQTGEGTGMTYYTYSVAADGSLSTASSTTEVASDPSNATPGAPPLYLLWIATDRTGTTLYSQQGYGSFSTGEQWIAEYKIGGSGSLSLEGSVGVNGPTPISFISTNQYGFYAASNFGGSALISLVHNADGTLTLNKNWQYSRDLPPSAGAPPASQPVNAVVSPATSYVAAVYEQAALAGRGTASGVAVFPVNSDGSSGTPTHFLQLSKQSDASWTLTWDSTGTYLFASDGSTIYEIQFNASTNTLSLVNSIAAAADGIEFLNGHLFAVNGRTSDLYVFNFSNGALTGASGSPIALGFRPTSFAASQR